MDTYGSTTIFQGSNGSIDRNRIIAVVAACVINIVLLLTYDDTNTQLSSNGNYKGRPRGTHTVKRKRRDIEELFSELTDDGFRRMFRMRRDSFWKLYDIIEPNMPNPRKRKRGKTPNGPIPTANRLAMALRYFCGGCPFDIGMAHGVNSNEVLKSAWMVVDAVNMTQGMNIKFPATHEEQMNVALGFKAKSRIGLSNCVGAVDGLLIWIHKPTKRDILMNIGFGAKKFFCGRKKKYGLNLMGTCDSRGYFLDVEVKYPGSSSDFYAFLNSNLRQKLEMPNFLAPGLCIYGDNAYVNAPYMVIPFKGCSDGPKDAFNYFHSSLRINIECAFGMLVHRWGMLRKPIPMNISVGVATSLVMCLCKLHNFCIRERDINIRNPLASDVINITSEGGIALPRFDRSTTEWTYDAVDDRIDHLLDGGEHFDDIYRPDRRRYNVDDDELPCVKMLRMIENAGYCRPDVNSN